MALPPVKISALPAAAALTGAEPVPVVQGGVTKKTTTQDIADLVVIPPDTGITELTGDVTAGPGSGSQAATVTNAAISRIVANLTQVWNNGATAFTAIKMAVTDTASLAASKVLDLLVGGTSVFQVQKDGHSALAQGTIDQAWIGSTSPQILNARQTITTDLGAFWAPVGILSELTLNPVANQPNIQPYGLVGSVRTPQPGPGVNVAGGGAAGVGGYIDMENTGTTGDLTSFYGSNLRFGGNTANMYGVEQSIFAGNGTFTNINFFYAFYQSATTTAATVTNIYGFHFDTISKNAGDTFTNIYGLRIEDLGSIGTNNNYIWCNGRGVFIVQDRGSTTGTRIDLHNPGFTKFTPGSSNAERMVIVWASNVLQMGATQSGTGTLRVLQLTSADGLNTTSKTFRTTATTVAGLPAGTAGDRAYVTDSTVAIGAGLGLAPVGGGANGVPVFRDGAGWKIG